MKGKFLKRYNRFLVDIRNRSGETITAYCPATGRLKTCEQKGAIVEYLPVQNDDRKLNYDWWSIKMSESWVVIDTRPANQFLFWNRTAHWLPNGWNDAEWIAEPSLPDGGRLDFRLDFLDQKSTWIEIKSVTWCENGIGYFPDAPTERGRRHLDELIKLNEQGYQTYVIFVSMRSDVEVIRPGQSIDPVFTSKLVEARKKGVKLLGIDSSVDARSIHFNGTLPVQSN